MLPSPSLSLNMTDRFVDLGGLEEHVSRMAKDLPVKQRRVRAVMLLLEQNEMLSNLTVPQMDQIEDLVRRYFDLLGVMVLTAPLELLLETKFSALRAVDTALAQSETDPLTSLLNRRGVENSLKRWKQEDVRGITVLFFDMDDLKRLNNLHRDAGDQGIVAFARTLHSSVRPGDLVARWGGDEFEVIIKGQSLPLGALVAERARAGIREFEAFFGGVKLPLSASVGVAGGPIGDYVAIRSRASTLSDESKAAGKDKVTVER